MAPSCSTEAAINQAAASGTRARACQTIPLLSLMRMQPAPLQTTLPSQTAQASTPSSHIATLISTTYLDSLASPGSHQRPYPFHQWSHTWALIGTWKNARWQSQKEKRLNIGQPSMSGCLAPPTTSRKSRSSTESCCMPASCFQPAVLTSPRWKALWLPLAETPLFLTMPLVTQLQTSPGGSTSSTHPESPNPSQAPPLSWIGMPSPTPAQVLASALLSATSGEPGSLSPVGKQMAGILDGLKPLASSFLLALSAQQPSQANISESSETTKELSKDGGRGEAGTGKQTRSSGESTTSQMLTSAFLSHAMLPAEKTQQTVGLYPATVHLLPEISIPLALRQYIVNYNS